jgi:hypothetical protein
MRCACRAAASYDRIDVREGDPVRRERREEPIGFQTVTGPAPVEIDGRPLPTWIRAARGPTPMRTPRGEALSRTPGMIRIPNPTYIGIPTGASARTSLSVKPPNAWNPDIVATIAPAPGMSQPR